MPRPLSSSRQRVVERTTSFAFARAEWLFALVALFIFSGAIFQLLGLIRGGAIGPGAVDGSLDAVFVEEEGDRRGIFYGIYAVMAVFALLRWRTFLTVIKGQPAVLALVSLALLSSVWSTAPDLTPRRGVALLLTTAFGWYVASRYSLLQIVRLVAYSLGAALVLSAVFGLALPQYGVMGGFHEGAWQGVFYNKNGLGKAAALAAWTFAVLWRSETRHRWLPACGFLLAVTLMALSTSMTAAVVLAVMLALLPFAGVLRWRLSRGAPILLAGLLIGGSAFLVLASEMESALTAVGRDPTLTGRTDLWAAILAIGMQRPLLGAGYSAFWSGWEAAVVRETAGWGASGAHNGLLDVWLDLGIAGVLLLVAALGLALRSALQTVRRVPRGEAAWPILCLAFVVLTNLTEGGILRQNELVWILFVVAAASAQQELRRQRETQAIPMGEPRSRSGPRASARTRNRQPLRADAALSG